MTTTATHAPSRAIRAGWDAPRTGSHPWLRQSLIALTVGALLVIVVVLSFAVRSRTSSMIEWCGVRQVQVEAVAIHFEMSVARACQILFAMEGDAR